MYIQQNQNGHKPRPVIRMFQFGIHLLLAGIVTLFLGICYAYVFSDNQFKWEQFRVPRIFWVSTFCVLMVSFFMQRCLAHYRHDRLPLVRRELIFSLAFAIAFLTCQVTGWQQMQREGLKIADTPSSGYIYVLSGLHALHITVGIVFLITAVIRVSPFLRDPVKSLLYLTDPVRETRLRLLAHYWHTIDFLWVFIFLVFLYQHA